MATPEELRAKKQEAARRYYLKHREQILQKCREYRQENREIVAERDRLKHQRARAKDPEKFRERSRSWGAANPEMVRAKTQRWMETNAERKRQTNREWKLRNAEKVKEQAKAWWAENKDRSCDYARKRRATPQGRIEASIRSGIYSRLRRKGGSRGKGKTFEALGYSPVDLVAHLERQFTKGMNWDNYGEWHIDHIVPVSAFDYATTDDPNFRAAWALTNLRPMWGTENYAKGAKRLTLL